MLYSSITDVVLNPIVNVGHRIHQLGGAARGLPADGARVGLHPDPERGDHAVRRLRRLERRTDPGRDRRRRSARQPGRLAGRLRDRLLRPASTCSSATASSTSARRACGRPRAGSSATARRHRLLLADAAAGPHLRLGPGRGGADAARPLLPADHARLDPLGPRAGPARPKGSARTGKSWRHHLGLPRLRDRRRGPHRHRLVASASPRAKTAHARADAR